MQTEGQHKYIGMEIGGTKLQLVSGTPGIIEQTIRYSIEVENGAAGIQTQIQKGLDELRMEDVAAIGVGFGGPVDWQSGAIRLSHQVAGWEQVNLKSWLEELTGKPVAIDNDANVAALAEAVHGAGKGHERVFYMTMGSGIGGGMVLHGAIYHGRTPGEVEVGHLRLDKEGNTLESKCSGWAVNEKVKAYVLQNPDSRLAQLAANNKAPEAFVLKPALEEQDEAARTILHEIADDTALALSHVVHLFHPDVLIIGGGLSLLGEHLRAPVAAMLPRYVMKAFLPPPPLQIAALGEQVVPVGALELAKAAVREYGK